MKSVILCEGLTDCLLFNTILKRCIIGKMETPELTLNLCVGIES